MWKCSVSARTNHVERIGFSSTVSSCTKCTRSNGADDKKSALEIGRKTMDKSCQVYGNFHVGNHNMIAGRRAYIAIHNSFCFAAPYQASRDKNTPVNNAIKVAEKPLNRTRYIKT